MKNESTTELSPQNGRTTSKTFNDSDNENQKYNHHHHDRYPDNYDLTNRIPFIRDHVELYMKVPSKLHIEIEQPSTHQRNKNRLRRARNRMRFICLVVVCLMVGGMVRNRIVMVNSENDGRGGNGIKCDGRKHSCDWARFWTNISHDATSDTHISSDDNNKHLEFPKELLTSKVYQLDDFLPRNGVRVPMWNGLYDLGFRMTSGHDWVVPNEKNDLTLIDDIDASSMLSLDLGFRMTSGHDWVVPNEKNDLTLIDDIDASSMLYNTDDTDQDSSTIFEDETDDFRGIEHGGSIQESKMIPDDELDDEQLAEKVYSKIAWGPCYPPSHKTLKRMVWPSNNSGNITLEYPPKVKKQHGNYAIDINGKPQKISQPSDENDLSN
eukprot:CAMPEP_0194444772 /NCGR_PEP_ID=MMETSP0176-20130528/127472_1 /TAXON_ID=216777 /ORGANISM="Proboscia alata, Strain PI-D3" /LENGTH=379 /DNA_ID=CAMNT_0039271217 /DNA_START=30 /DNA_END=1167 /DNA_ORIENTATION=+